MAIQDKTDYYWNWILAWAPNNLYYDFINVDVCHVPYARAHRNSSFFLKTRLWYAINVSYSNLFWSWYTQIKWEPREVTDTHIIRDDKCDKSKWTVYVMSKSPTGTSKRIFYASITDWCVWNFREVHHSEVGVDKCWDWKFLVTNFVRWEERFALIDDEWDAESASWNDWIQINKVIWGRTYWYFYDESVKNWEYSFNMSWEKHINIWDYIVVYGSLNRGWDGIATQVRYVTWIDSEWRLEVNEPWLWLPVTDIDPDTDEVWWGWLRYTIYSDWWETVWYTWENNITILTNDDSDGKIVISDVWWEWQIIWTADANDKVFILLENWYVWYTSTTWWYNKFMFNESMFAWTDKIALTAYRDILVAFWRQRISAWVPDEKNIYYTMYNQSVSIWIRSRYAFAEQEWVLFFVTNDKRLFKIWISDSVGRYMLDCEDVGEFINWKLSTLVNSDEVYISNGGNELKVFINSRNYPYKQVEDYDEYNLVKWNNVLTHIFKYDNLFKVWTEDFVPNFRITGYKDWIYIWEHWLYDRVNRWANYVNAPVDVPWTGYNTPVIARISAYLIENEIISWQDTSPRLYNLAKLNRLITTLWPWIYSNSTKIRVTSYRHWIWAQYEFPVSPEWNDWLWRMTDLYSNNEVEMSDCLKSSFESAIQDSQTEYKNICGEDNPRLVSYVPQSPWCESVMEYLSLDYWACLNNSFYKFAPTMPLTTNLGENQNYSTQIKLELIWGEWDIICFWWWLAEMFIAPMFTTWSDWEYELKPVTSC